MQGTLHIKLNFLTERGKTLYKNSAEIYASQTTVALIFPVHFPYDINKDITTGLFKHRSKDNDYNTVTFS